MIQFSQTTGYAILALSCLEGHQDQLILARQISECTGVPQPYLVKILHSLSRAKLVVTKRGYRGGYKLARPAEQVTMLDITEAVEGHSWQNRCFMGLARCSDERHCPMHEPWSGHREQIIESLRKLTLTEMAEYERGNEDSAVGPCCDKELVVRATEDRKARVARNSATAAKTDPVRVS